MLGDDAVMLGKRLTILAIVAFCALFSTSIAWADNGYVIIHTNDANNQNYAVRAQNRYNAAVYALGANPDSVGVNNYREKLSDPNYGGAFYEFANTFDNIDSEQEIPSWYPIYALINVYTNGYPFWATSVSNQLYSDALRDFNRILDGEDLSGNGNVDNGAIDNAPDYVLLNSATGTTYVDSQTVPASSYIVKVTYDDVTKRTWNNYISQGFKYYRVYAFKSIQKNGIYYVTTIISKENIEANITITNNNPVYYTISLQSEDVNTRYHQISYTVGNSEINGNEINIPDSNQTFNVLSNYSNTCQGYWTNGDSITVLPPDGDWPDDTTTVAPTSPNVPEPYNTTTPIIYNPVVDAPAPQSNIDYRPYFERLYDYFEELIQEIIAEFNELEAYLYDLFRWLASQFQFSFSADDSQIVYWLKRIWAKIGGSSETNTFKPNIQQNEPSFWDWLMDIFRQPLDNLFNHLPDGLQDLLELIGQLRGIFPFSLPWDMIAILTLFNATPATPIFDLPLGYSANGVTNVHVDMTPWNNVMAIVRSVEYVIFAFGLAKLTFKIYQPDKIIEEG